MVFYFLSPFLFDYWNTLYILPTLMCLFQALLIYLLFCLLEINKYENKKNSDMGSQIEKFGLKHGREKQRWLRNGCSHLCFTM